MRSKSVPVLCLALLATLMLVAAGCGGGKKNAAATTEVATTTEATTTEATTTEATTTEAASTTETATQETTTEAASTTETATQETTTTETTTTAGLSGIASAGNCKELSDLGRAFAAASGGSAAGADVKKQAALFKEFADKAPKEIRADFQLVADYFSSIAQFAGAFKSGQTPDPETLAKLQNLQTQFDATKLTQASQNIAAWATKNCHA